MFLKLDGVEPTFNGSTIKGSYLVLWYDYTEKLFYPWRGLVLRNVELPAKKWVIKGDHCISHPRCKESFLISLTGRFGADSKPFPLHEAYWNKGVLTHFSVLNHYHLPSYAPPIHFLKGVRPDAKDEIIAKIQQENDLGTWVLSESAKSNFLSSLESRRAAEKVSLSQNMFTEMLVRDKVRRL